MSSDETSSGDPSLRLLRRLSRGLDRRRALEGAARIEVDKQLLQALDEFADTERQPPTESLAEPPPRAVAVAMATALFSQPHLPVMCGDIEPEGTEHVAAPRLNGDPPFVIASELLQESLGLPNWELEDIREEVDRRVGTVLKQARALKWTWSHFGLPDASPDTLFRVLFPAAPGRVGPIGIVRRGPQMYAIVDQEVPPPLESLFLPWIPVAEEKSFHPSRTFVGKYVNSTVRRSIGRGVGASDDEVVEMLDRMVTIVPRTGSADFVARDAWRARGMGVITDVPAPYGDSGWLSRPLDADEISTTAWLRKEDDRLEVRDARAAFDVLAVPRTNEMLRQLYGMMFARLLSEDPLVTNGRSAADLQLFDVERHLRTVLQPLVDWARDPRTIQSIAAHLQESPGRIEQAMAEVALTWSDQLDQAWLGIPKDGRGRTVQALLTSHLVVTQDSLTALLRRRADVRAPHRDVALLFAAHYFATAPLERLWAEASENSTWPSARSAVPDAVAQWFWGAWTRVLDHVDDEVTNP